VTMPKVMARSKKSFEILENILSLPQTERIHLQEDLINSWRNDLKNI